MIKQASRPELVLIGRFPPPADGKSLATMRLKELLEERYDVKTVNTMVEANRPWWQKISLYRGAGYRVRDVLRAFPAAPVVWTSISPHNSGHWRDRLTLLPYLKGRTVTAVVHWGMFSNVFSSPLTKGSARKMIKQLSRVVFTAENLSNECAADIDVVKRITIPNGLDGAVIPPAEDVQERIDKGPSRPFRVLFLSNMFIEKGWEDVLEAAAIMRRGSARKSGLAMTMVFAGAWPSATIEYRFTSQVERLQLQDSVIHLGALRDRRQIRDNQLKADVFVLPSWLGEAQPLSILEAMAAGTPCIVSDAGAMPDMIGGDEAGRVVPVKDPAAIAEAITTMMDPEEWGKCALAARERFESHYNNDVIREKWMALLESIDQEKTVIEPRVGGPS